MSKTASDRQARINNQGAEQIRSIEAESRTPGSRSLQAGGEFLKALAGDLGAVASWLRLLLITKQWRPPRPRVSAPRRTSWGSAYGRTFHFLSLALFGLVSVSALGIAGLMLWALYGVPGEPRKRDADTLGLRFEARKEPPGHSGPLKAGETSQHDFAREPGALGRLGVDVTAPSIASLGTSASSSAAAEPEQSTKERQTAAAGADQPPLVQTERQDGRPTFNQQEISRPLTYSPPPAQCNVDLCKGKYNSFNAADCSYQPYGGGPRTLCELGTGPADGSPQTSRAPTDPKSEMKDARSGERTEEAVKPALPAQGGAQCNVDACAARYASFHAPDCTYQPHGGGPRRLCELSNRSAADARPQASRAGPAARPEAEDTQIAEKVEEVPESATPARTGAQCNVGACAAMYGSFHAADCTYQPYGGGPRQICEQ
jgi:hypothetical protein